MDEHEQHKDKHDAQAFALLTKALQDLTSGDEARCLAAYDSIASALRATHDAAVAAERERCVEALRARAESEAAGTYIGRHIVHDVLMGEARRLDSAPEGGKHG